MPRWHSWIARPPPKGQVSGSNPLRGTTKLIALPKPFLKSSFSISIGVGIAIDFTEIYTLVIDHKQVKAQTA